jgi:hypothetical protein
MKTNPLLEEVWRIKDAVAREAGNDIHVLCEQTRTWAAAHLPPKPPVSTADQLRKFFTQHEAALHWRCAKMADVELPDYLGKVQSDKPAEPPPAKK